VDGGARIERYVAQRHAALVWQRHGLPFTMSLMTVIRSTSRMLMVIVSISLMTGLGNLRKPVQLVLKTPEVRHLYFAQVRHYYFAATTYKCANLYYVK
jgi:hypothetical protein